MTESPAMAHARAALAQRDEYDAGRIHAAPLVPKWDHLRAALAEVDRLKAELDCESAQHCITLRFGEGIAAEAVTLRAEIERLKAERDEAIDVIAASERWITIRDEVRRLGAIARPGAVMLTTEHPTELEALIAALEAAPEKT